MVDQLHEWLKHRTQGSSTDPGLSEDNYQAILSRFCGKATRPFLTLPDGRRVMCTPSSLQQAVSLTGELFNGDIIHLEHHQLLSEAPPRVFLSGPPGSGKTTSLLLIGNKWLSEGHKVCVLNTWRENRRSSKLLFKKMTEFLERRRKSHPPEDLHVCPTEVKVESTNTKTDTKKAFRRSFRSDPSNDIQVIFKDVNLAKNEIKTAIKKMKKRPSLDGVFILVDDAGPNGSEDQLLFKSFCEQLVAVNQDLHLWAASCLSNHIPNGWNVKHFRRTVSCPPAILREKNLLVLAQKNGCKDLIKWDPDKTDVAPTEGLPVKYVYHHGKEPHAFGYPFACEKCCLDVIMLLKALGLDAKDISYNCQIDSTAESTNCDRTDISISTPQLTPADVLVLLEHELCEKTEFCKETNFFKTLQKFGFRIKVGKHEDSEFPSKLWISNPTHLRGLKRKIVVYVEGRGQLNKPLEWMRLRGVTSCTSQLIWVKDVAFSQSEA